MSVVAITGYTGLQLVMVENQHLLCYRLRLLSLCIQFPPHIPDLPIHGEVYKSVLFLPLRTFNCSLQASLVSISVAWRSNVTYYKNDDIFRDTDFTGLSITVTWWWSHTKMDQNMLSYWTTAAWSAKQAGNNRDPEKWAGCRSVGVLHGLSQTLRLNPFWLLTPAEEQPTHTPLSAWQRSLFVGNWFWFGGWNAFVIMSEVFFCLWHKSVKLFVLVI